MESRLAAGRLQGVDATSVIFFRSFGLVAALAALRFLAGFFFVLAGDTFGPLGGYGNEKQFFEGVQQGTQHVYPFFGVQLGTQHVYPARFAGPEPHLSSASRGLTCIAESVHLSPIRCLCPQAGCCFVP